MVKIAIDGIPHEAQPDELLIDLITRTGGSVPARLLPPSTRPGSDLRHMYG